MTLVAIYISSNNHNIFLISTEDDMKVIESTMIS